jgi:hypothetical protein
MVQSKVKVRADLKKNRLYCTWEGSISKSDLDAYFTEIRFGAADLQPGFSLILDLTVCQVAYLDAIGTFKKVMQYLMEKGVRDVVRVVTGEQLVKAQVANLNLHCQSYEAIYVKTLEEAESYLENSAKRSHIRLKMIARKVEYVLDGKTFPGVLRDLSLGGCAVETQGEVPERGQVLQVQVVLSGKKTQTFSFELEAKVVRSFSGGFALEFMALSQEDRQRLNECIAVETSLDSRSK